MEQLNKLVESNIIPAENLSVVSLRRFLEAYDITEKGYNITVQWDTRGGEMSVSTELTYDQLVTQEMTPVFINTKNARVSLSLK
ncbi:unnamed protein product, partial [marine sediment metagenome]